MRTRREFLVHGGCAVCAAIGSLSSSTAKAAPTPFEGCFISPEGLADFKTQNAPANSPNEGLLSRYKYIKNTGDRDIDHNLDRAMEIVADLMHVKPSFSFYEPIGVFKLNEPDLVLMNAWADGEHTAVAGTKGLVCFGKDLFQREFYNHDRTGTSVITIIAHEYAHVVQADRGYLEKMKTGNPRKSEINADFLAGYFLGTRKSKNPKLLFERAGDLFIRLGKTQNGRADRTHGNSKERLEAAEAGFRVAYVHNKTFNEAVAAGKEYVGVK